VTLSGLAQLSLDEFPSDMRLYGRVGDERVVAMPIKGTITSSTGITSLSAKLLVGTQTIDSKTVTLGFNAGVATFDLTLQLPVTRTNHRVELRNLSTNDLLATAEEVVAGDVYVVNGQSNALASYSIETVDRDPFLRGYNSSSARWTEINNVPCGEWMGRTANEITNEFDLPIGIFNFAVGGQKLVYFQPGASSRNFETSFEMLRNAGVRDHVKGFFWSQGEADGFNSSIKDYRANLTSLFDHYLDSLTHVDEVFLWQVRAFSCSGRTPNVMEAQRRMNDALDYVTMLSTVNVEGDLDSCHFPYINGREILGNWMADLLRAELYSTSSTGYLSPTIDSARITGPRKITLFFDLKGASRLATSGAPWRDFQAEGIDVRATGGSVTGNTVNLLFDTSISGARGVSYLSHLGNTNDHLHSNLGIGVVTFFNESLTPGDRALGSVPDADLRMQTDVTSLVAGTDVTIEVLLINQGERSLRETEVHVPLPASLRYGDGNFADATEGDFDDQTNIWLAPFVRPGETATLSIRYRVLDASAPIFVWAEVIHSETPEADSAPMNGIVGRIQEDDEARVVLGNAAQDCSFSAQLISSECLPDSNFTYWRMAFATEGLPSNNALAFIFSPSEALNAQSSIDEEITLSFDTLSARSALPLVITLAQNGDATCASRFSLNAPDSCQITSVMPPDTIDTSNSVGPKISNLSFSPNPVRSGGSIKVSHQANLYLNERAILFDATGRKVYSIRLDAQQTRIQLPGLPAGIYLLRVGRSMGKVLVY